MKLKPIKLTKTYGSNTYILFRNNLTIRILDLFFSLFFLLLLVPILLILIGLKFIFDKSPIFYISKRIGLHGKEFKVFKFRTMINNRNAIIDYIKNRNRSGFEVIPLDAPIYTSLGKVFERFQIVEIPQLVNVIIGNMSFIGYRPLPQSLVAELQAELGNDVVNFRHIRIPGLTGWSQLMGKENISNDQRVYLENSLNLFLINEPSFLKLILVYMALILDTINFVALKRTFFLKSTFKILDLKGDFARDSFKS